MEDTQKPCTFCGVPADTVPIFVGHAAEPVYGPLCDACILAHRGGKKEL
jgi:hypothetical protein